MQITQWVGSLLFTGMIKTVPDDVKTAIDSGMTKRYPDNCVSVQLEFFLYFMDLKQDVCTYGNNAWNDAQALILCSEL